MSEFEPDSAATAEKPTEECRPRRPLWLRILRGVGIAMVSLLVIAVVSVLLLYNFGGMSGSAVPGVLGQYDQMVAAGQAPAIQKRFVIPIPGCQCHSKDPVLTAQHTRRRMNECDKCHNTKPAHMEPGVL
jgi:hypothetical protein